MNRLPNRSLNSPWPAVPMAMPKMAELPMIAASPGVVKPDLMMNGISAPRMVKSMTSQEISGGDQRDNPAMQRRDFRLIQSVADKGFDCLRHTPSLPYGRLSGSERRTLVGRAPTVNVGAAAAAARTPARHAPSNCKMYKPALESVTYIRASASTKQSHDWITCGRFGRGSNMRSGGGGTK